MNFAINESNSGVYRAIITDESGGMLPGSTLSTLTLTLYVIGAGGVLTYVNSRNNQNVLNTNGVQVFDTLQTDTLVDGTTLPYNIKWTISPADVDILNDSLQFERHCALFNWTWPTAKQGHHEVTLVVKNLKTI